MRQRGQSTYNVPRREVDNRFLENIWIVYARRAHCVVLAVHVVKQPEYILGSMIALQSPRSVRVADGERKVRNVTEHHSLIYKRLRQVNCRTVYGQWNSTDEFKHESSCRDYDVGLQMLT